MRIFAPEPRAPRAPLSASPDDVFLGALLVGSQTLVGLLDRSKEHEVLFPPSGGPFRPFRSSRQVIDSMLSAALYAALWVALRPKTLKEAERFCTVIFEVWS